MSFSQKIDVEQKIAEIEHILAEYIVTHCNCDIFSDQYITQGMLMCGTNQREFIFQAKVLSTADTTGQEFRDNFIQKMVNEKPIVSIAEQAYQVDSYCSVEIVNLGTSYCYSDNPTVGVSQHNDTKTPYQLAIEITAGAGAGIFLVILVVLGFCIACCCCSRKSVKRKYHEPHREGLDIQ